MITRFKELYDPECHLDAIEWPDLFSEFSKKQPFRGNRHPGWSPAEFEPAHRALQHVKTISALVLDYDNQTKAGGDRVENPITIDAVCKALGDYYGLIHTTRHHTEEWPRFRVILPLTRPVNRLEYTSLWQAAARLWPGLDPAPKDPSRFWYTPGVAEQQGADFKAITLTGAWLDPDQLANEQTALLQKPAATVESDGLMEARARAYIDKMPPAVSGAHGHKALWNVTRKLVCDFGLDEQAAYRILQTEYNPRCQPPWSEKDIRHKLREALTKSKIANPIKDRELAPTMPTAAVTVVATPQATPITNENAWKKFLRYNDKGITKDVGNVALMLKNLPGLKGCLCYDRMAYRAYWQKEPGYDVGLAAPELGETLQDHHIVYIQHVLAKEQQLSVGKDIAWSAIEAAAHENSSHPVQEYLNALVWDGQPRLTKWLTTYVGCDDTEYNASVGRWWMISAVARAMQPGCQVDYCLILEGPQGYGKSQAIIAISDPWYLGALPDIRDRKEAADTIGGSWIIEIAELDALKGASMTRVKEFVTQQVDKYRPAYARATAVRPRSCVFIGTTNEKMYLSDPTGARRFWPVEVKRPCATKTLVTERDQLWAEAVAAYRSGEQWYPDRSYLKAIEEEQAARYMEDEWTETIQGWITRTGADETGFTVAEILGTPLNLEQKLWDRISQMRVGAILTKLGYVRRRVQINGQRVYRYFGSSAE